MQSSARRSSVRSARSSRQSLSTILWDRWDMRSSEIFMPYSQYNLPLFCQPILDHPQHLAPVDVFGVAPKSGDGLVHQAFSIALKGKFAADILGNGFCNPLDHGATLPARCNQAASGQVVVDLFGQALYLVILQSHNASN